MSSLLVMLAVIVALSVATSTVTTGSECACGDLTDVGSPICRTDSYAWTARIDLEQAAFVSAVLFEQLTDDNSDVDVVASFFCSDSENIVPSTVTNDEPFHSFTFTADPADDNTCVTVPLSTPLLVPNSCVLFVELKAVGAANAVAFSGECNSAPVGATSRSYVSCAVDIPTPLALAGLVSDVVIGVECI